MKFTCRKVGERDVAGSNYGSPAYGDLWKESQVTKKYEEQNKEVTAESFRRWPLELREAVSDRKRKGYSVWVTSAAFRAMRFASYPRGSV